MSTALQIQSVAVAGEYEFSAQLDLTGRTQSFHLDLEVWGVDAELGCVLIQHQPFAERKLGPAWPLPFGH
jgi:hypothetical protein